jgi:hypothetical protein
LAQTPTIDINSIHEAIATVTGIDLASVLAIAEMQSIRLGANIGLGIGLGVLPLLQNEDPWGTGSVPKSAANGATLSAIGASGNFATADLMATYGLESLVRPHLVWALRPSGDTNQEEPLIKRGLTSPMARVRLVLGLTILVTIAIR